MTQQGSSGWHLNLRTTATAISIPTCEFGTPQSLTATQTAGSMPLLHTGDVALPTGVQSYVNSAQRLFAA